MEYHRVKVPHAFFQKAKREYHNWRYAFFREAIQNAYDAKASEIHFKITSAQVEGEEGIEVVCADNGCGMGRDTLTEVLLCLGGSQKDPDAIGGFGYAKNLLFFSHDQYQIWTREHRIVGTGGEYRYTVDPQNPVKGTHFSVHMAGECEDTLKKELQRFVHLCRFRREVTITLNGETLESKNIRFPFKLNSALGAIAFRDSTHNESRLWVYVRGLPMFAHSVWIDGANFEGILELERCPMETLTTNRDGLRGESSQELHSLFQVLSAERTQLKLSELIDVTLNPGNYFLDELRMGEAEETAAREILELTASTDAVAAKLSTALLQSNNTPRLMTSVFRRLEKQAGKAQDRIQARFSRLATTRYPHNFRVKTSQASSDAEGYGHSDVMALIKKVSSAKLAYQWSVAVANVLRVPVLEKFGVRYDGRGGYFKQDKPIRFGFVFEPNAEGLNSTNQEEIVIALNPILADKFTCFGDLLDVAIHECTHIIVSGHNESFTETENAIRRQLRRIAKEADIERHARRISVSYAGGR